MQDLIIALLQADQVWENKTANFSLYEQLLAEISDANLILLPEMFQTAFSMHTEFAENYENSTSINWLKEKAHQKKAAFYTSLMIEDQGKITNRGVFVYPDGNVQYYDKRKTFTLAGEHEHFDRGETNTIVDYLGWKIQLNICYDLRFPEIMRNIWDAPNRLALYDVLLFVANWPAKRGEHWRTLLKARAIENQCIVAAVNRVGTDQNNLDYAGDSVILNALGETLDTLQNKKGTISAVIPFESLQKHRQTLPFLQDQSLK